MTKRIKKTMRMSDVKLLIKMMHFASKKHKDQRRYDEGKTPYINHPIDVAYLIMEYTSVTDVSTYMAALAHDLIEDQGVTREEIVELFGEKTAGIVVEVTDDDSLTKNEIKKAQIINAKNKTEGAAILKIADKISSMIDTIENPPPWPRSTKLKSFKHAKKVVENMPSLPDHVQPLIEYFYEVYDKGIVLFKKK